MAQHHAQCSWVLSCNVKLSAATLDATGMVITINRTVGIAERIWGRAPKPADYTEEGQVGKVPEVCQYPGSLPVLIKLVADLQAAGQGGLHEKLRPDGDLVSMSIYCFSVSSSVSRLGRS